MLPFECTQASESLSDLNPHHLFPHLGFCRIVFHLYSEKSLPPFFYFGSAWRGVLGWELKRLICPFPKRKCADCSIQDSCPYYGLFERQVSMPGIYDAPRGYVLYPSRMDDPGGIQLTVSLMGQCAAYIPAVIESVSRAASRGVGRERIVFALHDVQIDAPPGYDPQTHTDDGSLPKGALPLSKWLISAPERPDELHVSLPTPLRLRRQGKYLDRIEWPFLFQSLARRLEGLACIFGRGQPMGAAVWKELVHQFSRLSPPPLEQGTTTGEESSPGWLKWKDFERYSNRQKKKVPMGGLVGQVVVSDLDPWLHTWLQTAQIFHVGKGAAMGLGRVELQGNSHV